MTEFDIVVATDAAGGIGKDGRLPWQLPGDTAFFKRLTTRTGAAGRQNAVVMGRKTWESIPTRFRPLECRLNVVVTRQADYLVPTAVIRADSLNEALSQIDERGDAIERAFVIGGGETYRAAVALPSCRHIYLTRVQGRFDCDAQFPDMRAEFNLTDESEAHHEGGIGYTFQTWSRVTAARSGRPHRC